jgi:hypothetical protein
MERPRLLPETDFAIITNNVEDSREIGKLIEKYYPEIKHAMFWNGGSNNYFYSVEGEKKSIECRELHKASEKGLKLYTIAEFNKLIEDSEKPVDAIINTYNLY